MITARKNCKSGKVKENRKAVGGASAILTRLTEIAAHMSCICSFSMKSKLVVVLL